MKRRNFLVTALAGLPLVGGFWKKGTASWREMPVDESAKRWNRLWHASAAIMMIRVTNQDVSFNRGTSVVADFMCEREELVWAATPKTHIYLLREFGKWISLNETMSMKFYPVEWKIVASSEPGYTPWVRIKIRYATRNHQDNSVVAAPCQ